MHAFAFHYAKRVPYTPETRVPAMLKFQNTPNLISIYQELKK